MITREEIAPLLNAAYEAHALLCEHDELDLKGGDIVRIELYEALQQMEQMGIAETA